MDSDDDMGYANDLESVDDDFDFYGNTDRGIDSDADDNGFDQSDDPATTRLRQKNYVILKEEDICQRQEDDITRISTVLSVAREAACILLHYFKWDANKVHEAWFADESGVRKAVGLLENPAEVSGESEKGSISCGICFEEYNTNTNNNDDDDNIRTARCGHAYCGACWRSYISTSINDGPGCLTLRCPDPSCDAAVGRDMMDELASSAEEKTKYRLYLVRSYVESNRKAKWCPAPDCDCAVEYVDDGSGSRGYDVCCLCSYGFCWNCREEAHRPVDCDTVAKWILKNSDESENLNWILVNSKPCPKCKRPIQKNQGCMHMTCRPPCCFQFCWICLGNWSSHGLSACNRYRAKEGEEGDEAKRKREMAKSYLERYTHHYERWAANHSSLQKAVADLHKMQDANVVKLNDKYSLPDSQVKFIIDAWLQIVECRRVLKWSYAYGYYLPEDEHTKRQFFEYLQGEAEAGLERLHHCAEQELQPYLADNDNDPQVSDFNGFRAKLIGLTSVTRNYFENLVRALENGLTDVDFKGDLTDVADSKGATSSKRKCRKRKRASRFGAPTPIPAPTPTPSINLDDSGFWACHQCTYSNVRSATTCLMCNHRLGDWACAYCTYLNDRFATSCQMCNHHR